MRGQHLSVAVLVATLVVACVEGSGWWMDQPYGSSEDFNLRVEYGEDVNVTCVDPRLDGTSYTVKYWVIPDMTIMYPGDYLEFKTFDGQAGWDVSSDGFSIRLFLLQENHFGFYYCLAEINNDTEVMVKRAVNYGGPFFDDLWDDYRLNTIVACSSSITFLAIVGSLYGFNIWYEKRQGKSAVEPIEDEDEKKKEEMESQAEGYSNGAYSAEMKEKDVVDQQPQHSADEDGITKV